MRVPDKSGIRRTAARLREAYPCRFESTIPPDILGEAPDNPGGPGVLRPVCLALAQTRGAAETREIAPVVGMCTAAAAQQQGGSCTHRVVGVHEGNALPL